MPGKARKFSDDHRAALERATVDEGISPPKAAELAARGELPGLPAFSIHENTVREIRDDAIERRAREGYASIEDPIKRGLSIAADIATTRLEVIRGRQAKTRDRAGFDPLEVDRLTAVLKRIEGQQTKPSNNGSQSPVDTDTGAEKERRALERRLSAPSSKGTACKEDVEKGTEPEQSEQPTDKQPPIDRGRQAVSQAVDAPS